MTVKGYSELLFLFDCKGEPSALNVEARNGEMSKLSLSNC